jgi:Holliday junction resolvase RusA-like endonuclease
MRRVIVLGSPMTDIFTITVPIPKGTYPSVNHTGINGFRGGGKSKEYRELFASVKAAAIAEMARTGWTTAEYDCAGWITRYHPHARKLDCSNLSKAENDALEEAGVVLNDTLIRPIHKDAQYDKNGPDRIVIVLQRLYPRITDVHTPKPKPIRTPKVVAIVNPLPPVTKAPKVGLAYIDGKVVPYGEAMRAAGLTADKSDKRKRRAS